VYAAGFGCFELSPPAGAATIGRNYGRGPANVNIALRVAHTWEFGREGRSGMSDNGGAHAGPPAGMFATGASRRYQLTLSASTLNALNRANYSPPDGDLVVPLFRAVSQSRRADRDDARRNTDFVQQEGRRAIAVHVLKHTVLRPQIAQVVPFNRTR
jgi:hypothetical protein